MITEPTGAVTLYQTPGAVLLVPQKPVSSKVALVVLLGYLQEELVGEMLKTMEEVE